MPIEALVTARFKTHQQNLETYQQAFTTALRQEFPLSAASRDRLRQTQQQLELADRDIAAIESQITAEVEAYHQKLQDYQRLFLTATKREYPLSAATRTDLRQQQQRLGLTDVDVAPIEAQITTQIESYHQKLQQYEQAFVKATQRQHYPDEVTRKQLQQTWQTLGLSKGDVGAIERRINAEIETHQANLRQYEQEFTEAIQQEYPLSAFKRSQLTQRHQALNLTARNVTAIENPIIAAIEEHQQKLQQYEQVFRESIQFEYPLSDVTREELQRFQRILELNDAETSAIEAIIIQSSSQVESRKQQQSIRQQKEAEKQQEVVQLKQQVEKQPQPQEAEYRQELIKSPIQQSSSAQPTQSAQERITRQKFLWVGLGGAGLVIAVLAGAIFSSNNPQSTPLSSPEFISSQAPTVQTTQASQKDAQSEARRRQLNEDIRAREQRNNATGGDTQRDLKDLASEVRSKLEANIPNGLITVDAAEDGTVTVGGTVNNQDQLAKIERLSKEIKGVKAVVVKAVVAPPTNR
ncbi:MAG: BON domain-containing protein [Nostoc sp. JL33]|nr:BON domain-containing protein [Nostoc sp. JL33]